MKIRTSQFLMIFLLLLQVAEAAPDELRGHVKLQAASLDTASSPVSLTEANLTALDLRVHILKRIENFEIVIDPEVLGIGLKDFAKVKSVNQSSLFPNDDDQLFDLSSISSEGDHTQTVSRFDRLSIGWKDDSNQIIFGRQAVSWGQGLTFQVIDLLSPFAPTAIDKDYKSGSDLIWAQSEVARDISFDGYIRPGRDLEGDISANSSTAALQLNINRGEFQYNVVAASHYDDELIGSGFNLEFLEAIWRTDLSFRRFDSSIVSSVISNIDRGWIVCNHNLYLFIEYFHNGLAESQNQFTLSEFINRGEIYTVNTDYLSFGARLEISPLNELTVSNLISFKDSSGIVQAKLSTSLSDSLELFSGVIFPYGGLGSEFGATTTSVLAAKQIYLRLGYYY